MALGALCGFVGGLFGVGGGVVAIPVLGIFFGLSEQAAQGTALVMILPNVSIGLWRYLRRGALDLRMAAAITLGAFPTVLLAAWLATRIPSTHLRIGYALFLIALIVEYARRSFGAAPKRVLHLPWPYVAVVGAFAGLLSGVFIVGGTLFAISLTTFMFGISQLTAQGLALAYSVPGALITSVIYARAGDIDWALGVPLAIGGVTTVAWGVDVAHRLPERTLRLLYIAFILASSVSLLIKATTGS